MKFLRQFVSSPITTGSITSSSRYLARAIIKDLDLASANSVLEYGPGTGSFTELILSELGPDTKFAAIELNPNFAKEFEFRYPHVRLFRDSVSNVRRICEIAGIESVDCIVSGLPWALFPENIQAELLRETLRVMTPDARFATFSYVHSLALAGSKRFTTHLTRNFESVSKSPIVWRNLPPAFVYRCRRPRRNRVTMS